jgi:hypothetical protein
MSEKVKTSRKIALSLAAGVALIAMRGDTGTAHDSHAEAAPKQPTAEQLAGAKAVEAGRALAAPFAECSIVGVTDERAVAKGAHTDTSGSRTTLRVTLNTTHTEQATQAYADYATDTSVKWYPAQLKATILSTGKDGKRHKVPVSADDRTGGFKTSAASATETVLPRTDWPVGTMMAFSVADRVLAVDVASRVDHDFTGITPCEGGAVMGVNEAGQREWQLVNVVPDMPPAAPVVTDRQSLI